MAERLVGVIKPAVCRYISVHGTTDWDEQLPSIHFGGGTTVQSSAGYSPYFVLYGRNVAWSEQYRTQMLT
eukprot:scaffold49935_cov19-Prasinocladus_malaysianus.AAC.1